MQKQLKILLQRLRKPSVLLSLASQVVSLLIVFGFNVNTDAVIKAVTIITSILATLGILSNPDSTKAGYNDDILHCLNDDDKTQHVFVNGEYLCKDCGTTFKNDL